MTLTRRQAATGTLGLLVSTPVLAQQRTFVQLGDKFDLTIPYDQVEARVVFGKLDSFAQEFLSLQAGIHLWRENNTTEPFGPEIGTKFCNFRVLSHPWMATNQLPFGILTGRTYPDFRVYL